MKKTKLLTACVLSAAVTFVSCGFGQQGTTSGSNANMAATGANVLGALLGGGGTGANAATGILTGVIGMLTSGSQSGSIIGTWSYSEPSVEFESENLLAQAGGAVIANQVAGKISPYYERIGIKPGAFTITFKEDKTCTVSAFGQTQAANYEYDAKAHTLKITGQTFGLSFGTTYVTVGGNQMSITLDASKLLSVAQTFGAQSGNATVGSLSQLASSFKGMKTGFKFVKK